MTGMPTSPLIIVTSDRDRMLENQRRINSQTPNPDTWVREALRGQEALYGDRPDDLHEVEWDILRAHVIEDLSYMTISKTILREPEARIRAFAEDACRKFVPARAQAAQLAMTSPEVIAELDGDRALLMNSLSDLYRAVGSPLGATPEGQARWVRAMAGNAGAIQALRKVAEDGPLMVETGTGMVGVAVDENKPL